MDILPETEIQKGQWDARRRALQEDVLDKIPFTTGQKKDIEYHLAQLEAIFTGANTKVTHCTRAVEGGAALCGVKLDCHVHDWRARADVDVLVADLVQKIHPADLGAPTAELEAILRAGLENKV